MKYYDLKPGTLTLPAYGMRPATVHVFDDRSVDAIKMALAAERPLLVRGEPGTGKSQLARAAAAALRRAFIPFTVDARTEARDLRFRVDTVARLADAQVYGHRPAEEGFDAREALAERRYTEPGPLWWVFNWRSAEQQTKDGCGFVPEHPGGWDASHGAVLLIDEIDKADPAVPNGLLEALGEGRFKAPGGVDVAPEVDVPPPLVLITTNEERALPDAFVRRCLVLQLSWSADREKLIEQFVERGRAHFRTLDEGILHHAAAMVADDRETMMGRGMCPPGCAEYLDLLRAVVKLYSGVAEQRAALTRLRDFALRKHPEEPVW